MNPPDDASRTSTAVEDVVDVTKAGDIFLAHGGMSYLPVDGMFRSIALASRDHHLEAVKVLNELCKTRHPSLVASSPDGKAVTFPEYQRFKMSCVESLTSGRRETLSRSDIGTRDEDFTIAESGDIAVLFEISRDDRVVLHGVESLAFDEFALGCDFNLPNAFAFDAPLPDLSATGDKFSVLNQSNGTEEYPFYCESNDTSIQLKALCKVLFGEARKDLLKPPFLTPLHAHVVWKRYSTGEMVTVLSETVPKRTWCVSNDDGESSYGMQFASSDGHFGINIPLAAIKESIDGIAFSTSSCDVDSDRTGIEFFHHYEFDEDLDEDLVDDMGYYEATVLESLGNTLRWG